MNRKEIYYICRALRNPEPRILYMAQKNQTNFHFDFRIDDHRDLSVYLIKRKYIVFKRKHFLKLNEDYMIGSTNHCTEDGSVHLDEPLKEGTLLMIRRV